MVRHPARHTTDPIGKRAAIPYPTAKDTSVSLYDSVSAANEPDGPNDFGAGYGDGLYDNWAQVQARFGPRAVLEVCVNPRDQVGNCLDVENGDARPEDAPGWTLRARNRGVKAVWNYCNYSTWPQVICAYLDQGMRLPDRWWIAEYNGRPHLPQVTVRGVTYTADACQYTGGMTASYDTSCFRTGAFTTAPPSTAPPITSPEELMALPKLVTATNPATGKSAEYVIREGDVRHAPDAVTSAWAYTECNGGTGPLEAVAWEVILWWNNDQTPAGAP